MQTYQTEREEFEKLTSSISEEMRKAIADYWISKLQAREEWLRKAINEMEVKGNRVGNFELGDKVLDFANELLDEFKEKALQLLTPKN